MPSVSLHPPTETRSVEGFKLKGIVVLTNADASLTCCDNIIEPCFLKADGLGQEDHEIVSKMVMIARK